MKDFKSLKFLDKFKGFFNFIGVDYHVMRRILQVKLTMDARRVPTIMSNPKKENTQEKNNFRRSLWIYILFGLFMIPFVIAKNNYLYNMSFVFGFLFFFIMTSLISDFSSVLLDIRDKNIISSKPVSNKTLSIAKTIHILIYMFSLTGAIAGPALIVSLFRQGPLFFIIFLFEVILVDIFIVVLTALFYMLILKFFDGEKLKDIINYVQIILSLAIVIGYQFIGRLFEVVNINVVFTPKWWQYLIIPIWFGAPFDLIIKGCYNTYFIIFTILAVWVPVISIIIYIKFISYFEQNLQKLNNNSSKSKKGHKKLMRSLSKIICHNENERTFFRFTSDMMKNEREFKLKVYPSLGFAIIFPFIFIFNQLRGSSFSSLASSKMYLNIYFCVLMLPTVVTMLKFSGKYKAAWIYGVIPFNDTSSIIRGSLKAFIIKLMVPVYAIDCILFVLIFGVRILPDLILVFLNILFFTVICFRVMKKALPFSMPYEATQQSSESLIIFPLMLIIAVLAGIHYACTFVSYGIFVYMVVVLIVNLILWKKALNISFD